MQLHVRKSVFDEVSTVSVKSEDAMIIIIDRFKIALFPALEQAHCAHIAYDFEFKGKHGA